MQEAFAGEKERGRDRGGEGVEVTERLDLKMAKE